MNPFKLIPAILLYATTAFAQHNLVPATVEVLAMLDSAKLHQKENGYLGYLERAEALAIEKSDNRGIALVNQRLGTYYYTRDARKAITFQKKASEYFYKAEDAGMVAICMQNIGFIYDEQLHDVPSAIEAIDAAIYLHKKLRDTLQFANICKYKATLVARQGDFKEAKRLINKAILYFGYKDYKEGIAVSWFDMAMVFKEMKQYDSVVYYLHTAKKYWVGKDKSRVFGINNKLLALWREWPEYDMSGDIMAKLSKENFDILITTNIYWLDKLSYYEACAKYCDVKKYPMAVNYLQEYQKLSDSLASAGIKIPDKF